MSDCGCQNAEAKTRGQRRVLRLALALNVVMFLVETGAGLLGHSSGLIADGLDMLADSVAYGIALAAVTRDERFKARAAHVSGAILLALGVGVIADAGRRLGSGDPPQALWMMAVAGVALVVNATVLRLLGGQRHDGPHMRAAWIFTRADVVANMAVMISGAAVAWTGIRLFDLAIGAAIGLYVIREALDIFSASREKRGYGAVGKEVNEGQLSTD
jgi:cation diffusion facilitator family transporter